MVILEVNGSESGYKSGVSAVQYSPALCACVCNLEFCELWVGLTGEFLTDSIDIYENELIYGRETLKICNNTNESGF